MKIRKAKLSDAKQLKELYNNSVVPRFIKLNQLSNVDAWIKMFKQNYKNTISYVIEKDNKIIGFINAEKFKHHYTNSNRLEVLMLMVHKDYQKKGYGTKLIDKIKEYAKKKKIHKIILSVLIKNKKAVKFYKKNGFKPYRYNMQIDL